MPQVGGNKCTKQRAILKDQLMTRQGLARLSQGDDLEVKVEKAKMEKT